MVNKKLATDVLAAFDKLAQSAYADAAYNAVMATPPNLSAFTKACIDAKAVTDNQAGKDMAKLLFKIAKKIIKDGDWGWD